MDSVTEWAATESEAMEVDGEALAGVIADRIGGGVTAVAVSR